MLSFSNSLIRGTYLPWFNISLWSISVGMIFYVWLPLLAWGLFRLRPGWSARLYVPRDGGHSLGTMGLCLHKLPSPYDPTSL